MAKVLVVGGAGYIGSATVAHLLDCGHEPWVLDDLSTGYRDLVLVPGFTHAQAGDVDAVRGLLTERSFDCVMHFAARSLVGESVHKPDEYYENNVLQTQRLLEVMLETGHHRFVFSSTCAVFGDPGVDRIDESCPKKPINPYGQSKLAAERLLERLALDQGLQSIALRYFNAAGADPRKRVGERHYPETHLLPRVLNACREGREVEIYGTDYPTDDGTCIRDYVHVTDLARAHEAAMRRLIAMPKPGEGGAGARGKFEAYNLGSENGFSVREVIEGCALITEEKPKVVERARRPGDPSILVGDSELARKVLGFQIEHSLEDVIRDALEWDRKDVLKKRKAVFLDRDGTLNEDPGYLSDPAQVKILPGVPEGLAALKRAGYLLIVVSNQSGINRGLVKPEALPKIHDRINALLRPLCSTIFEFICCVHRPDENCECRKPKPALYFQAAEKFNLDLSACYMVGDKLSDIEAGANAGVKASILLRTGEGKASEAKLTPGQAAFIADSLREAADWILRP